MLSSINISNMTEYLRSIINAFHDLIFIFNEDGVIIEHLTPNQRSELIAPRDAFMNKKYKDVLPSNVVEEMDLAFEKIRNGASSVEFDYSIVNKGERHWYSAVISILDEGINPSYLGIVRNVTNRVQITKACKESEKKYKAILENALDIFYQLDKEGNIKEISPAVERHLGYKPKEVIGKSAMIFHENPEAWLRGLEILEKKGEVIDFEVHLKTQSNEVIYGSINAHLLYDDGGNNDGIQGFIRNITKRKKAEDELKEVNEELWKLNRQKDKLFSVIAHDMKNTVSGPLGLYDFIFDSYESLSKKELFEYLQMLRRSTINQSDLLNDLLMWSRNQFKNSSVSPELVNLVEIVNTVLKHTETSATDKNISIDTLIEDNILIYADPDMLKTILRNLVNNAIKFSHPGGKVQLDAQSKENNVSVSVSDDGVGMSDDVIKKIFNKDIHYTTPGTKEEKGSGLGLDLCVDFVEKHNGSIKVNSQPGEGTKITFTLPEKESGK